MDWLLCGIALLIVLTTLYSHSEGNRISATRFVYHDIRREMGHRPKRLVWWRAFNIAMGWRLRPGQRHAQDKSMPALTPKPLL